MSQILSAKAFNEMQDKAYKEYCDKCTKNGTIPAKQERYYMTVPVQYGYVQFNSAMNNIRWKKRKKDFYQG